MIDTTTVLDAARALARRGIGTIPLQFHDKPPAIPNPHPKDSDEYKNCKGECGLLGHGVHDATTDDGQLVEWFGPNGKFRNNNLGAAVPVGFVVLDIDKQHGGDVTFKKLCDELGDEWALRAPRQRTGNGGVHLWFREEGAPTKVRKKLGIDVRRVGAYVVVEPSIHENGKPYVWERELPT